MLKDLIQLLNNQNKTKQLGLKQNKKKRHIRNSFKQPYLDQILITRTKWSLRVTNIMANIIDLIDKYSLLYRIE